MTNWDEIQISYEILKKGRQNHQLGRLASCMLEILPALQTAVNQRFENVRVSSVMFAIEVNVPATSQAVVIQCVDECKFVLRINSSTYEVLKETEADLSNVVERVVQFLELSKQRI